jgi:predicted RNA binding protein YcfA (HicA-like mRNA interferase family)
MPPVPLMAFRKVGYEVNHQIGSHIIVRRTAPPCLHLSIPNRRKLPRGSLRKLIRDAGLTVEEFIKLLD